MKQFDGFPDKMQFTPLPNIFYSTLLPEIGDIAELKTTLYIFWALYRRRGHLRFITRAELLASRSLMRGLSGMATPPEQVLRNALETATKRGTLLHLVMETDGAAEDIYFLNTEAGRQAIARIQRGELELPGRKARGITPAATEEPPDIFTLYEQNIGMLTPMIADELLQAERLYPETWIRDAIKEAVAQNKRSWRYMAAILERWSVEGKGNGTHRRDSAKKTDPDKYIRGKYGHIVQR